jgi:bifunctional non-homologous end joining protein LigD
MASGFRGMRRASKLKLFEHARALNLEGIVSKRMDSRYRSGPSRDWWKIKNPEYERR